MRLHIHRDPNWQKRGVWACYECRCGARRVRRIVINLMGPVPPGWPQPVDTHGVSRLDSGWQG